MTQCAADACNSNSDRGPKKLLFRFPSVRDEKRRNVWKRAVCRENFVPSENSRLCEDHFAPDQYIGKDGPKLLKPTAVPTISRPAKEFVHTAFDNDPNRGSLLLPTPTLLTQMMKKAMAEIPGDVCHDEAGSLSNASVKLVVPDCKTLPEPSSLQHKSNDAHEASTDKKIAIEDLRRKLNVAQRRNARLLKELLTLHAKKEKPGKQPLMSLRSTRPRAHRWLSSSEKPALI